MDDEAAMALLRHGDLAGLEPLYRRHFPSIYRFAARQCRDGHAAEDIAQTTFIRAFRYAASHRTGEPAAPWLFRIAYRLCLDHARRSQREGVGLPTAAEPAAAHEDRVELADLQCAVDAALAMLPPGQRAAFLLHRVHGRPVREVAGILGCPVGTVKSRIHHAARRLRPLLTAYLEGESP